MEVVNADGTISRDLQVVPNNCKTDFSHKLLTITEAGPTEIRILKAMVMKS